LEWIEFALINKLNQWLNQVVIRNSIWD